MKPPTESLADRSDFDAGMVAPDYLAALKAVGAVGVLARSVGSPELRMGMVDGPIRTDHPDLAEARIASVRPEANPGCRVRDSEGCRHGTVVAGILAAARTSKVPGLAPGCPVTSHPIFCEAPSVEHCPPVSVGTLTRAIDELMDAGARLINLSVGLVGDAPGEIEALHGRFDRARERGVLIVASAGNTPQIRGSPLFRHPWVISVGPIEGAEGAGPNGALPNLRGPAGPILALDSAGGYRQVEGTSVAAPFVTGIAALLWSLVPDAPAAMVREALLDGARRHSPAHSGIVDGESSLHRLRTLMESSATQRETTQGIQPPARPIAVGGIGGGAIDALPASLPREAREVSIGVAMIPQGCSCASPAPSFRFVYAAGHVKAVFPSIGLRKEYERVAAQLQVPDSDLHAVLTWKDASGRLPNLFIAQELRWVFEIGNVDTYLLVPRGLTELGDLVECLKAPPKPMDEPWALVVGMELGTASGEGNAGLAIPWVVCNQVYHFTLDELLRRLTGAGIEEQALRSVLESMSFRPNAGAKPQERAMNYVAFRYPEIYRKASELARPATPGGRPKFFLQGVRTRHDPEAGKRQIVDVVFEFQSVSCEEQQFWYCSVDVSGQFPFLNTPLRVFVPES